MNISLIGYGKMGKEIEQIALARNHTINYKIDSKNSMSLHEITSQNTDVAIEFTAPNQAFTNISYCLKNRIPVVSGTTGWLNRLSEIQSMINQYQNAFFYASNYSIGMNIFFKLNQQLAQIMHHYSDYDTKIRETHHTEKKDAPSGTAISLAEIIAKEVHKYEGWTLAPASDSSKIEIEAVRAPHVPGTHEIKYTSEADTIQLIHTAHHRKGFALGAVLAAEWLPDKIGMFGMKDLLGWA